MVVGYWNLKNKDPGMIKFGEERAELILNEFKKLVQKYTKGSYEYVNKDGKKDESVYYKSDQRIDFMINVYQEIIKRAYSKLSELQDERDRRSW